jgi:YidC/Oxa1 family membrane protein insertase
MDRKSIIILVLCVVLFFSWGPIMQKLYPTAPVPPGQTTATTNGASLTSNTGISSNGARPTETQENATAPTGSKRFVVSTNVPEELVVLTNDNARYTFTSRGGGLKEVQLLHYPETVATRRNKGPSTGQLATLNGEFVPPVFAMIGDTTLQGDGNFKLTPIANGVRAEKALYNGVTLVKEFRLSTNYLVSATLRWENGGKQTFKLPGEDWAIGSATPMGPKDNGLAELVMWFDGAKTGGTATLGYFRTNTTTMFVFPRTPLTEYLAGSNNIYWASAQNQFFTLTTIAATNTPAQFISVRAVDLPEPSEEEIAATPGIVRNPRGMETVLHYPEQAIAAGQASELHFNLFAGPKEYETLASLNARFNNDIDLVMNFGFWGAISKALLISMNWLYHHVVASYGWIIIFITIVLKLIFWPLTRASTRSMKRMQALQPELKAMQAKYKDDPTKLSQKQWEFYKKNKVNPLGGCLPMLLQIPVFFGLLTMLRNSIELRGAHFLWMSDLSQPDTIGTLPIPGHPIPINLMPLLMGGTQFWLMSMTPPSPGMDPAQQKMMRYMPLIFVVFLYNYSSGLALYWTVSNLLSVLQTKVTKTYPITPGGTTPAAPAAVTRSAKR